MGWLRRTSAALLLLGAAPTGIGPAGPLAVDAPAPLLVTVGDVAADRALLWARAERGERLRIRVGPDDDSGHVATLEARPSPAWDYTFRLPLTGLRPGTRYAYEIETDFERAQGSFRTAPPADGDVPAHVVWSGDLGGAGHCRDAEDGYRIFHAMSRRAPDLFLFVGDTIYADHTCGRPSHVPGANYVATSLDEYRAKHRYNRADAVLQTFFRTTAVFAIWDDHEVVNNFSGPTEALMPAGRQAFRDYWPIPSDPDEPDRLYRSVRWGRHVEIFILDTRQYRSPNGERDNPDKTMLGLEQRRWLIEAVTGSDATWKLIVTSVPLGMFTGGFASDSWSNVNLLGYPRRPTGFVHERDLILDTLRRAEASNVVFISGDVHHAELIRHEFRGWTLHEFVAGPLAARSGYPRFLDRSLHSRSLASLGWRSNFGEIVADGGQLQARILDASGAVRATLRLAAAPPTMRRRP